MLPEDADFTLRTDKSAPQLFRHRRLHRDSCRPCRCARVAVSGGARDGHDGRHRGILDKSPDDLRGEGRDAKTTGGALARRGVLVSAGGYARPPTMQTTTGGAESSPVMDMLAGLSVVAGA